MTIGTTMRRSVPIVGGLALTLGLLPFVLSTPAVAQTAAEEGAPWTPPRTPDGHPDLQGVWKFATVTPLERPEELSGKAFLTEEEAAAFARETVSDRNADPRPGEVETRVVPYNNFWWDRGTDVVGTRRTSLIVDPPDGRLPPLTAAAQRKATDFAIRRNRPAVGPEDRSLQERCIVGFNAGPPIIPAGYNQQVQLFQGPGYAVILNEMVHNARVVPVDDRPHLSQQVRQLAGDSRGSWEGETLVVETTNFRPMLDWPRITGGISDQFHLTERFTRVGADVLLYEFTVDDPATFARSWSAEIPMTRIDEEIYEYACHEGNYGMTNLLQGARVEELVAAAAKAGSK